MRPPGAGRPPGAARARRDADPLRCTLEELNGIDWGEEPVFTTHLARGHFRLGRVPIGEIDAACRAA